MDLAEDVFGNYVIQKIFEHGNDGQREALWISLLHGNVAQLSKSTYGCRVVQKAFARLPTAAVAALVEELQGRVASLACDKEGKYSVLVAYKHTRARLTQ